MLGTIQWGHQRHSMMTSKRDSEKWLLTTLPATRQSMDHYHVVGGSRDSRRGYY